MAEISIIMPSFNVANYIEECIESVINQSYSNIEIIIVDAGSTDGTLDILRRYEKSDERIILLNSERKSYGFQVNMGIECSKGKYVAIVETDDYIEPDMIEHLYTIISKDNYDYAKGVSESFSYVDGVGIRTSPITVFGGDEYTIDGKYLELAPCEHPELLMKDRFLWTGLYSSDFIKKIKLNETAGAAYQDIGFLVQVFTNARKAIYSNKLIHHYRQDNANASGYSPKAFQYLIHEYEYVDELIESQDEIWGVYSTSKLLYQLRGRISNFAMGDSDWDIIANDVCKLQERVQIYKDDISEETLGKDLLNWSLEFIENPNLLYLKQKDIYNEKKNNVRYVLEKAKQSQIIIFGCGKYGIFLSELFIKNHIESFMGFCDNNESNYNGEIHGYTISSPLDMVDKHKDAIFVIAVANHSNDIKKQLIELDVRNENIIEYTAGINSSFLEMK